MLASEIDDGLQPPNDNDMNPKADPPTGGDRSRPQRRNDVIAALIDNRLCREAALTESI